MPFGGGGGGETLAHVHTNDAGQGGELTEATLIQLQEEITLHNLVPVGTILMWGGLRASIPTEFLLCDGSAVSRTTYADLFAVFSTRFGVGDGSTTFNLPNYCGTSRFPRGGTGEAGATGGADTHTLTIAEMPAHIHNWLSLTLGGTNGDASDANSSVKTNKLENATTSTGGGGSHENLPSYQEILYMVRF